MSLFLSLRLKCIVLLLLLWPCQQKRKRDNSGSGGVQQFAAGAIATWLRGDMHTRFLFFIFSTVSSCLLFFLCFLLSTHSSAGLSTTFSTQLFLLLLLLFSTESFIFQFWLTFCWNLSGIAAVRAVETVKYYKYILCCRVAGDSPLARFWRLSTRFPTDFFHYFFFFFFL